MDGDMTREHWLSLGLQEDALPLFEAGGLRTIEAADSQGLRMRFRVDFAQSSLAIQPGA